MAFHRMRELKDHLSRFIRRIEAGERIAVTAHGRVVGSRTAAARHFDDFIAAGVIRPPLEAGDPTEGWPAVRLSSGTPPR